METVDLAREFSKWWFRTLAFCLCFAGFVMVLRTHPDPPTPIGLDLRKPSEVFTSLVRKIDNIQLEFRVWNCSQKLARAFCPNLKCDEVEIGTNELLLCVASGEAYKLPTEK